jgi:hypothetical protein
MSVADQLCLWQISYVCGRSAMSVTDQLCLWQISYVCGRSAMIEWYIDLHLHIQSVSILYIQLIMVLPEDLAYNRSLKTINGKLLQVLFNLSEGMYR